MNRELALQRLSNLEEEAVKLREILEKTAEPEIVYCDKMPGYFWDDTWSDGKRKHVLFGFLMVGIGTPYHGDPQEFFRLATPEACGWSSQHRLFEPITEAILPVMIPHDGGKKPDSVHNKDIVIVQYPGNYCKGQGSGQAFHKEWTQVLSYQILKRFEQ